MKLIMFVHTESKYHQNVLFCLGFQEPYSTSSEVNLENKRNWQMCRAVTWRRVPWTVSVIDTVTVWGLAFSTDMSRKKTCFCASMIRNSFSAHVSICCWCTDPRKVIYEMFISVLSRRWLTSCINEKSSFSFICRRMKLNDQVQNCHILHGRSATSYCGVTLSSILRKINSCCWVTSEREHEHWYKYFERVSTRSSSVHGVQDNKFNILLQYDSTRSSKVQRYMLHANINNELTVKMSI